MNPLQSQLDQYKSSIDSVFTRDNLPGILAVLNSLITHDRYRVKESEYFTVVFAARADAEKDLVDNIIKFVNEKANANYKV